MSIGEENGAVSKSLEVWRDALGVTAKGADPVIQVID